jgi:hypothetical protein
MNTTSAWGLDFHYRKDTLYWSDTETRKVGLQYASYLEYIFMSQGQVTSKSMKAMYRLVIFK